ncbi:MAG: heavy-metal-associated domain-containing protein [Methylobacter sp.]|nr:heavy-metal-associated domain-containing protein [Methylobacter sp.]MDP2099931.1 heavy-metal-associated domain-containing protein [Methylobacter sp.]MDP2427975.1 heavy-metal-associated domain-containing protein [Methylobacter sp.]MDP3055729.1 heavy-metal-associated domain-containing protein [Methylobacter sp.]MDP3361964.1 heavy-metal-associated domain-containing protein [Methylobacter sp.]
MSESITLTVTGMKCGGCETNVSSKLQAIDGVLSVSASSKNNEVSVDFDSNKTSLDAITSTITDAGFSVETD